MPAWQRAGRWLHSVDYFTSVSNEVIEWDEVGNPRKYKGYEYPPYKGVPENLIYPIGYQPFMRCAMQYGYGIYMRTPQPLQKDYVFEKLRFKHSEKLSKNVFDMMEGGEKVYPHEGLKEADFIINRIRVGTVFSEEAFQYALYRSHEYALADGERCREDLQCGNIELEIFGVSNPLARVSNPEACGLRHLAFKVDDVEATVKELEALGIPCEPIRTDEFTGKKMTFFKDPDGLPLELHE